MARWQQDIVAHPQFHTWAYSFSNELHLFAKFLHTSNYCTIRREKTIFTCKQVRGSWCPTWKDWDGTPHRVRVNKFSPYVFEKILLKVVFRLKLLRLVGIDGAASVHSFALRRNQPRRQVWARDRVFVHESVSLILTLFIWKAFSSLGPNSYEA